MPATYEAIASVTLGSDALYVEFTDIPGTYTDLLVVGQLRSKTAGSSYNSGFLRFNADSASLYSDTYLLGDGSSASSGRTTGTSARFTTLLPQASNANRSVFLLNIMSYANANVFKTFLYTSALASAGVDRGVALYRSTSAITSVRIARDFSANLEAGSSVAIYGIKASA